MADFMNALPYILQNEGGYTNNPSDTGGETYRGISRVYNPNWMGWPIVDSLKPLNEGEIIADDNLNVLINQFYKYSCWDQILGDGWDNNNAAVYLVDFYVTAKHNAVKCVQRVVGATPDGLFGNASLEAVNSFTGDLLASLRDARINYYNEIGTGSNSVFLKGWLNRANSMYDKLSTS